MSLLLDRLLERLGPFAPAPGGRTAVLYGLMFAACVAVVTLVDDADSQMNAVVPPVIGGAVLVLAWQRSHARRLGLNRSSELPTVPLPYRLPPVAVLVVGVGVLLLADRFYSGWWGIVMVPAFALDDLLRRRAFWSLLGASPSPSRVQR